MFILKLIAVMLLSVVYFDNEKVPHSLPTSLLYIACSKIGLYNVVSKLKLSEHSTTYFRYQIFLNFYWESFHLNNGNYHITHIIPILSIVRFSFGSYRHSLIRKDINHRKEGRTIRYEFHARKVIFTTRNLDS